MNRMDGTVVLTVEEYEDLAQRAKKGSSKLCCSKKLLIISWATTILLNTISLLAFFLTEKDTTPLGTLTSLSWGVTAAVTAGYLWKAKAENKIKLTNIMVRELADKYGIEAVVSLLGITLSE